MGRNSKRIIRPINGLRGLTVASAIILHFSASIILLMPVTKKFVLLSNRIVFRMDLCFRLSGFITAYIYISLSERLNFRAYKEFLQARLIRLYPQLPGNLSRADCGRCVRPQPGAARAIRCTQTLGHLVEPSVTCLIA